MRHYLLTDPRTFKAIRTLGKRKYRGMDNTEIRINTGKSYRKKRRDLGMKGTDKHTEADTFR